ncbi:MAG: amino acid permease [Pirellulales bacterium]|nr:amino acid permease [Pirellulales bacterium]
MEPTSRQVASPAALAKLGLWDAVSLVIGIVVGTAIFRTAPLVFQNAAGPWRALAAWGLGGVLSLVGALCYGELATTYARNGGDYEYLTQAYGRWAGFLFGWAQLVAVWTASVGTMAYAFGDYGVRLLGWQPSAAVWLAAAAVVGVAAVNLAGMAAGKWTQNVLTLAKVAGLVAVVIAGVLAAAFRQGRTEESIPPLAPPVEEGGGAAAASFGLAMVFVLYAYGGWNDAAFVAAEVRNRRRNLPLALIGGVAGVTLIYLAVNGAYLAALGFARASASATPATDALAVAVGPRAAQLAGLLVMISALGAINGMIFTGSRVFAAFGADHRLFRWLGRRDAAAGSPWAAVVAQAAVTLAMIFGVGTLEGQRAIDAMLGAIGLPAIPWSEYFGGFDTLLAATAPVFWALFLAVGAGLVVLRWKHPQRERPFSVPLYPLPPLLFCATCGFMLYSSLLYARRLALLGVAPVAIGVVLYVLTHVGRLNHAEASDAAAK